MVICGNRLCKNHDNKDIYTQCTESPYPSRGKTIYVNLCPNENVSRKESNEIKQRAIFEN